MKKYAFTLLSCLLLAGFVHAHHVTENTPPAISVTEYRIKLDIHPNDVETRNKLANVLLKQGKLAEASEEFGAVLRRSPDNYDALVGIGSISMQQGRYKEAIRSFEKAKEINGNRPEVYYHLGRTYRMMGMNSTAIEMYRKSLSLDKNPDILRELGELGNN